VQQHGPVITETIRIVKRNALQDSHQIAFFRRVCSRVTMICTDKNIQILPILKYYANKSLETNMIMMHAYANTRLRIFFRFLLGISQSIRPLQSIKKDFKWRE